MVDHPKNQGERQHWRARVTLEHREQCVHPQLPLCSPPLASDPPAFLLTSLVEWQMCSVCDGNVVQDHQLQVGIILRYDEWRTSPCRCPEPRKGRIWGYSRHRPAQCDGVCLLSSAGVAPSSARLPEEWGWEWWRGSGVGGAATAPLFNYKNREELNSVQIYACAF